MLIVIYQYLREALLVCSFNSDGQYQSLYAWDGQTARVARFFLYHHIKLSVSDLNRQSFNIMKHKLLSIILSLVTSITTYAYDFEADGFYFNITDTTNHEVEVTYKDTKYASYSGVINIPSTVTNEGTTYTVTSIGLRAFQDCGTLPSVIIPNTVNTISDYAFKNTKEIYSLTIGANVQSIGHWSFTYSSSRSTIKKAIWLCNTLPSGYDYVPSIINYVSSDALNLTNKKVYPFLSSRFEVDNVVYVPVSPSDRTCDVIDCIYNPSNGDIVIDSIVSNHGVQLKVLDIKDYSFYNNDSITSLTISNAGNIGIGAFASNDRLTTVSASNNGYIGTDAFNNCTGVIIVNVSNNGDIGERAFYNCESLTSVTAKNNGDIGSMAFCVCDALTTVNANNNGRICSSAFRECPVLISVTANNNGGIGSMAFWNCSALTSVTANNSGEIGTEAFRNCSSLTELKFGNNVSILDDYSFSGCSKLSEVIIPDNVSYLGSNVFDGCSELEKVEIGYGISKIPSYGFSNCNSLRDIKMPSTVVAIGDYAFKGCSSLADITFKSYQQSNKYFDDWTSSNHDNNSTSSYEYDIQVKAGDVISFTLWADGEYGDLVKADINGNVIASISGKNTSNSYVQTFITDADIKFTISYTKDESYSYSSDCGGIKNLALNDAPITLGSNQYSPLFADCPLDEVYIGKKLSYKTGSDYGYSPFYRNTSLRSVKITDAETEIYDNEFYGCSNLQEFECGDGVEKIGNRAFSGCSKLASYSSGTNVKEIGEEAFSDCTAMTSFTSHAAEPPVCGNQALDDINKWECTLHVPAESIDDYKAASQWKEFFFFNVTGVDDITTDGNDLSIKVIGTEMTIEGAAAMPVAVYTIDGRLCATYNAYNGESISLGKGCYIVRAGNNTAKVMI